MVLLHARPKPRRRAERMARLQLNKSSLARETANLRTYQRFLPSLDLKRQQLMAERAKAVHELQACRKAIEDLRAEVGVKLPMLANTDVDITGLARITKVELGTENLIGTRLPVLERIEVENRTYSFMAKPHWVDAAARVLQNMLDLRVKEQVAVRRVELLNRAVDTITQRVNLFDKVLIPRAKANIKKIRVSLADEEMAAVVRSKIAKRKNAAASPEPA